MSLVNVSLKFQTLISNIRQYFLLKNKYKKLLLLSFISVVGYKVVKDIMNCSLNELVKLTLL